MVTNAEQGLAVIRIVVQISKGCKRQVDLKVGIVVHSRHRHSQTHLKPVFSEGFLCVQIQFDIKLVFCAHQVTPRVNFFLASYMNCT